MRRQANPSWWGGGVRASAVLGLAAAVWFAGGCGSKPGPGTARYHVSGTVTYQGKPVPAGSITFQPDGTRGNAGPAGGAAIQNGKYDTRTSRKGTVGGPHIVQIEGLDGPDGNELFPEFTTTVDLPKQNTTQDFDVPAAALADRNRPKASEKK